jgi:hypothetical protein
MLISYGNFGLSFTIGGSATGAAFLTDPAALANGRTGDGTSMQWIGGAQTTASYVQISVAISSPLDTIAPQGAVGVANVQGLPVGTLVQIGSVLQRLTADARGQLNAWALPFGVGNTRTIKIFNDVFGVASIPASQVFAIGEIFIGRLISLPTLVVSNNPSRTLVDPTANQRTSGGQLWQLMRKPYWSVSAQLGRFTRAQAKGGLESNLPSGGNPAGVIDIQTLMMQLSTAPVCAICDAPSAARELSTVQNGIRFDQDFMQAGWMCARPSNIGQLIEDASPYWSWSPAFEEAL